MKRIELINKLIKLNIIKSNSKFNLQNAGETRIYFDIKNAYGDPQVLSEFAKIISNQIESANCVAGTGAGGIPLAVAIALNSQLKLTIVRDSRKGHGTRQQIEGYTPRSGDFVWLVDDVVTTGAGLRKMSSIIKKTGAKVSGVSTILKRTDFNFKTKFKFIFTDQELKNFISKGEWS